MDEVQASIERGFSRYLELIQTDRRLNAEFERSKRTFFGRDPVEPSPLADRRHLEWFLLERPSATLEGVPVVVLRSAWFDRLGTEAVELAQSFQNSLAGAFELTSPVPGEGLWVRDLFALGHCPVVESEVSRELERGDLLVGRLFPVSGAVFALSPAVCCFRNPHLLEAARHDIECLRQARRGVLRIQQIELEQLFFRSSPGPKFREFLGTSVRERLHEELRSALSEAEIESTIADLQRAARRGENKSVLETLNRLAFETRLDLSGAQRALAEYWASERIAHEHARQAEDHCRDPRVALQAFDRGRAQGRDLEDLFRALEQDLGLSGDPEGSGEADEGAPDIPGVVGALVEEFLWEAGREEGVDAVHDKAGLRRLGHYGGEIGQLEDLGTRQLLDFAGRWLLDEGHLSGPEEARRLLSALGAFCRWCEERHSHPLWRDFHVTLRSLHRSVPRLVRCRQEDAAGARELLGAYRILRLHRSRVVLQDLAGSEQTVRLTPLQRACLRPGDLVRLVEREGELTPGRSYPSELIDLIR